MKELDPFKTFVISDTHFGHANILNYVPSRQFWASSVDDMDKKLIEAWNSTVKPDDTILHLGDFALVQAARLEGYVKQLHGRKILVKGNHDRVTNGKLEKLGFEVYGFLAFQSLNRKILAVHAPITMSHVVSKKDHGFDFMLHGHTHGMYTPATCKDHTGLVGFDVGVDGFSELRGTPEKVPAPLQLRKVIAHAIEYGKAQL